MGRSRIWLLAFGLMLAVMGITATTASATSLAEWQIEGETMEDLGLKEQAVEGSSSGTFEITGSILGAETALSCGQIAQSGVLDQEGAGTLTITWSSCTVTKPANCTVSVDGSVKTELFENKGTLYQKLKPVTGEQVMEVEWSGALCSLDEVALPIKGSICEKTAGLEEELADEPFTASAMIQEEAGCAALKAGTTSAKVKNEYNEELELIGAPLAPAGQSLLFPPGVIWAPARPALCTAAPVNTFCPLGKGFKGTVKGNLKEGQTIKLVKAGAGEVTCTKSTFEGTFKKSGMGTIKTLTYTGAGVGGKCLSTIAGQAEKEVTITFPTLPTITSLFSYRPNPPFAFDGVLALASTPAQLKMKVTFKPVCTYQLISSEGTVLNPTEKVPLTTFTDNGVWAPVSVEGGKLEECPANLSQEKATYELKGEGANFYMTRFW